MTAAPSKPSNEVLDTMLASITRDVELATKASYYNAVLPIRERLGHRMIQTLSEADVEALIDWMSTEGRRRGGQPGTPLSSRSVHLTLGLLRRVLKEAVRRQVIPRNVAEDVRVPRSAPKPAERNPWTEVEVRRFLDGIRTDRLYPVLLLSLLGLRPAEVCGLAWSDVDLDAGTLQVASTRTLVNGQVILKATKTEAGARLLPLPGSVKTALKTLSASQAAEKLAAGPAYVDSGYVATDELGQPVRTDWLRRRAYKLMTEVGVRRVRLYDARHAALTYLAAAGVPDVVVSAWAGHADLSFTKRTYVHPDAGHLAAAADQLDVLLG